MIPKDPAALQGIAPRDTAQAGTAWLEIDPEGSSSKPLGGAGQRCSGLPIRLIPKDPAALYGIARRDTGGTDTGCF